MSPLRPLRRLAASLRHRLGKLRRAPPGRFSVRTQTEAAAVLAQLAAAACSSPQQDILLIGRGEAFGHAVAAALGRTGRRWRSCQPEAVAGLDHAALAGVGCVVIATADSRTHLDVARRLVNNPAAADIPLEYLALPHLENAPIAGWDRYANEDFVSPLLAQHGRAYLDIYRESLTRFGQKTDVRDYLDLCQLLTSVVTRGVPGNVAEFGSFRGHSGYLASRVLEHLGSDKTLYMFDTFDSFPDEPVGVDRFWSGTHKVVFEQVREKFRERGNVRLVKGDFTRTLPETATGPLALAYVDCDSFRATRFLLEYLWAQRIPDGGIVVLEDYGHAALLGNRVAVHEFFDGRRDAHTCFSHFSGFFIAVKLAPHGERIARSAD